MTELTPAPEYWTDFPLPLVRLLEETYDILRAEKDGRPPTYVELCEQMVLWMPGIGLEPWPHWEEGEGIPARRYMHRHLRHYRDAGFPEEGVDPLQLSRPQLPRVVRREGFCRNGHELDAETLRLRKSGRRECIRCRKAAEQRRRDRNEESGLPLRGHKKSERKERAA